jgi:hypothetical protein
MKHLKINLVFEFIKDDNLQENCNSENLRVS